MTTVCFIGTFPPTTGGQGLVNEWFKRMALEAGADVSVIDLSPRPGPLTWRRRTSRIPKVMVAIPRVFALLARGTISTAYIGVAGGYGQVYDIVFACLMRLFGIPIFLHHDGYAYLLTWRLVTATLVKSAGPLATHIVLCDDMQKRMRERYGYSFRTIVLSNCVNTERPIGEPRARSELKTIGFISNLSRSKGVLEFLEVAQLVCGKRRGIRALLAGSLEEPSLSSVIEELDGASWITYLGPVYGEPKARYFAEIDVLVYPTHNDAEPRVIHEALAYGAAVIARDRGCIDSIVGAGGGTVIHDGTDFVQEAVKQLLNWHQDSVLFSSVSLAALTSSARMQTDQTVSLQALIHELVPGVGRT